MNAEQYGKGINELFKIWKQQHANDENIHKNMPKTQYPEAFIRDGIPYPQEYFSQPKEKRVLFVLKESNTTKSDEQSSATDFSLDSDALDWYRQIVDGTKDTTPFLRTKLAQAFIAITNTDFHGREVSEREAIKRIAVINLNKRGGVGRAHGNKIINYTKDYNNYIKKQIELIDPKYIVCCGKCSGEYIGDLLKKEVYKNSLPKKCVFIMIGHPSRRISATKFVDECKAETSNSNGIVTSVV